MNPSTVADTLTRAGALLGVNRHGALVTDRVPHHLTGLVERHRAELALTVTGTRTGHTWHRCDTCGLTTFRKGPARGCYLTPRCPGTIAKPKPTPIGELRCSRAGCGRPAEHLTHTLEPLCAPDLIDAAERTNRLWTTPEIVGDRSGTAPLNVQVSAWGPGPPPKGGPVHAAAGTDPTDNDTQEHTRT